MLLPVTSSSSLAALIPLSPTPIAANSFTSQPPVDEAGTQRRGVRRSCCRVGVGCRAITVLRQPGERVLDGARALRQEVPVETGHGPEFVRGGEECDAVLLQDGVPGRRRRLRQLAQGRLRLETQLGG